VVLISANNAVAAQLARHGGEFQINSVSQGDQREVHLASLPDGGFVAMWMSNGNVAARRFDADTQPLGPEFQVNTMATNTSDPFPDLAAAADGSFFFAWSARRFPETPPAGTGIVGRRFDESGVPDGLEFQIALYAYRGSGVVAVGMDEFVVAWTDDYDYSGRARRVVPAGLSPEFKLAPEGQQYDFAGAGNADGSYRVVWYGEPVAEIQGRSFRNDTPTNDVFVINRVSSSSHAGPSICTHEDGSFILAWSTYTSMGDVRAIYRSIAANDLPSAEPAFVTPEDTGLLLQSGPAIACTPNKEFVAFWYELDEQLRGRGFNDNGPLPGVEFTIRPTGDVDSISIARLADGDLIVAWTDRVSGFDVFGQRFSFGGASDCPADCNRSGEVTIEELIAAVAIVLDPRSPSMMKSCLPADVNLDYAVSIDELVQGIRRALGGCA
jgi:hypothetical protein